MQFNNAVNNLAMIIIIVDQNYFMATDIACVSDAWRPHVVMLACMCSN